MSGTFLDDGITHVADQQKLKQLEATKRKEEGYVKVRALDPILNKMVNTWVKEDDATKKWKAEEAHAQALKNREDSIENKARKLEILKKEKELKEKEKELDALEKELSGEKTK